MGLNTPQIQRLQRKMLIECSNAGVFGQATSVLVFAAFDEDTPYVCLTAGRREGRSSRTAHYI